MEKKYTKHMKITFIQILHINAKYIILEIPKKEVFLMIQRKKILNILNMIWILLNNLKDI